MSVPAPGERKRKWDAAAPPNAAEAKRAAMEKIAKLNAMCSSTTQKAANLFETEIDINDSPARFSLTKGATQQQISKETGASVISRGRYHPPGGSSTPSAPLNERRLHIYITAENKQSFDLAVQRVNEIVGHSQNAAFTDKLYLSLDHIPPAVVVPKIMGPQGSFTQHIETTSGAKVEVKGRGAPHSLPTDTEPMHLLISGRSKDCVMKAAQLARSLVDTVAKELSNPYLQQPPQYQQPQQQHPYQQPQQPQQYPQATTQQPPAQQQYPYPPPQPQQQYPYAPQPVPTATMPQPPSQWQQPQPPPQPQGVAFTTPPYPQQPLPPQQPPPQPMYAQPLPQQPQQIKYTEEQEKNYTEMMKELGMIKNQA